ncbi:MAG: hypothetical protein R3261_04145, partial [Alphaproteobacteria bacterium]|nr:hypothetical protein [Alphaproteobacteria bacterium]
MAYIGDTSPLFQANEIYIEEMYRRFQTDPSSVDESWAEFFNGLEEDLSQIVTRNDGPSWQKRDTQVVGTGADKLISLSDAFTAADKKQYASPLDALVAQLQNISAAGPQAPAGQIRQATLDSIRALMLIR